MAVPRSRSASRMGRSWLRIESVRMAASRSRSWYPGHVQARRRVVEEQDLPPGQVREGLSPPDREERDVLVALVGYPRGSKAVVAVSVVEGYVEIGHERPQVHLRYVAGRQLSGPVQSRVEIESHLESVLNVDFAG